MSSAFEALKAVDVGSHIEKKGNLSYLSWAWAWSELKSRYPDSYYTIYENAQGWCYHTDGNTAWVKTGVTLVDGEKTLEHIEYLPIMDYSNRAIPLAKITSFDVNKAIQRSLTKAVARHGLGLYIYAGEDLPEEPKEHRQEKAHSALDLGEIPCEACGKIITPVAVDGKEFGVGAILQSGRKTCGKKLCYSCLKTQVARQKALKHLADET